MMPMTDLPPWTMYGQLIEPPRQSADQINILALDLATQVFGYAYFGDATLIVAGSVRLRDHDDLKTRLAGIGDWLQMALTTIPVDLLAIESPDLMDRGMTTTPGTLQALYGAWGVAVEAARRHQIAHVWSPDARQVRYRIVGRGTASKSEVQRALFLRGYSLPLNARGQTDHDAADAIALGLMVADDVTWARRQYQPVGQRPTDWEDGHE